MFIMNDCDPHIAVRPANVVKNAQSVLTAD